MEELLAEQDSDIKSFKHGDVVEGQVVRIDKDEILVDIGAKSEGVVSNRELFGRHGEGQPELAIGDTVLVYVLQPESPEGHVVLSLRRAGLERKWRAMQEQFEAGVIIEAPVIDHNKGGLIVDCGIRGFVPISQIVDFPRRPQNDQPRDAAQEIAEKLQPFVGRKLRLKILEVNRKANRLILSEKVALYEERREKRDELFSSLQVGQKVTGTVRSIAPFGVFIDLGGIDGLVHKSELSWNKVNNPEAGYQVGEEVEAEVIDINHERGRISLSIRRLQPDPWHSTVADFNVGDIIDGTVTKLVNFGAFVRVRDGLEGLIHISELSHQRVAHPGDVVHEGQHAQAQDHLARLRAASPGPQPQAGRGAARPDPAPEAGAGRRRRRSRAPPSAGRDPSAATRCPMPSRSPRAGSTTPWPPRSPRSASNSRRPKVDEVVETVAADEAAEEAARRGRSTSIVDDRRRGRGRRGGYAAEAIEAVAETVAADEAADRRPQAAEEIAAIVETVAADEADARGGRRRRDRATRRRGRRQRRERADALDAVADVVERPSSRRGGRGGRRRRDRGDRRGGRRRRDVEETAAEAVAEPRSSRQSPPTRRPRSAAAERHRADRRDVAADEAAEEAAADDAVAEIAEETMEANTKG